jgi:hypothetical protein
MNTVRIKAGAGCVEINHRHVSYLADDSGAFIVPAEVANELVALRVAAFAPDPAPVAPQPTITN